MQAPTPIYSSFYMEWKYENNPFDFVIDGAMLNNGMITAYELADRTLYVTVWNKDTGKFDMFTFDAFTGKKIANLRALGWDNPDALRSYRTEFASGYTSTGFLAPEMFQKNGNVILFTDKIYEFDRNLKLVNEVAFPVREGASSCYADSTSVYLLDGNYYMLENCYIASQAYDFNPHAAVLKLNSKFELEWRSVLHGVVPNPRACYMGFGLQSDFYNMLVMNSAGNELFARSFTWGNNFSCTQFIDRIDMKTGAITIADTDMYNFNSTAMTYYFNQSGSRIQFPNTGSNAALSGAILTADGYQTFVMGGGHHYVYNRSGIPNSIKVSGDWAFASTTFGQIYGMYIGDGFYISLGSSTSWGYQISDAKIWITKMGTSTDPIPQRFRLGHWMSKSEYSNVDLNYTIKMYDTDYDSNLTGFSFNAKDVDNRYAVETNGAKLELAKYVNGTRTILGSATYPFQDEVGVKVKIRTVDGKIKVFVKGIPFFDVEDKTYLKGKIGFFSDKAYVDYREISYKPVMDTEIWSTQYAIWETGTAKAEVKYKDITFSDPENDPASGGYRWTVAHTPRFMANQGVSALDGKTFSSEQLAFDKVGDYLVKLSAKDDPHPQYLYPDMTFDSYRRASNEFTQQITVHRRPISKFTLAQDASGKVLWTDTSYDPDRYIDKDHYSTEATGIDYLATRGVLEKKFYFLTPSGQYSATKLVKPEEKGVYEVGMAVKDEYGAWSDYTVVNLDVKILPPPNAPPVPGFTLSTVSTYRGDGVTIDSTAYDAEDGGRENLPHAYYIRNVTTSGPETLQSASRTTWVKVFNSMGQFAIRQVVEDSMGATAQIEKQLTIYNRLPTAHVTVPESADQNKPTKLIVLRPTFAWTYSDADGDKQSQFQARIYRYGGALLLDSGTLSGSSASWIPGIDLPEHTNLYIVVRVYDGYDWGDWSAAKYFYIETNRPPTGDFAWTPPVVYEGDTVRFNAVVGDPDGDALSVVFRLTSPSGEKSDYAYVCNSPYVPQPGPILKMTEPGAWTATMTVSDGKAPAVTVTKTVRVGALGMKGFVLHTEEWENNRLAYNAKYDPDRPPGTFWAGEAFVLEATATDTEGSDTKAKSVAVRMFGDNFKALTAADPVRRTNWSGLLRSADTNIDFAKLKDGVYAFEFTATYSNGTVKTDTVTIAISGTVDGYVRVHRLQ